MAAYNKELARKIVRLLESHHGGEVAAAARKLTGMAHGQGQNLDEMLAAIYGGAAPETPRKAAHADAEPCNTPRPFRAARLIDLQNMFDEYGTGPLSPWEAEFVSDILGLKSGFPSDKQAGIIDRILARYKSFAARNGDEKSFWSA